MTEQALAEARSWTERRAERDALFQAALDVYANEIGQHGHATYGTGPSLCKCGWEGRSYRSVGMHVAAAEKRASRKHDQAVKDAIEATTR